MSARAKILAFLWFAIPISGFFFFWLMPDSLRERMMSNRWRVEGVKITTKNEQNMIDIHLHSFGKSRQPDFDKRLTIDLGSGKLLNKIATTKRMKPTIGSRTYCRSSRKPPGMVAGELLLEGAFICDGSGEPIRIESSEDNLVSFQDLRKEMGKLNFGRLGPNGKWVWLIREKDWAGTRERRANGYRIAFAAKIGQQLFLVLEQDGGVGDIRLLSIGIEDGRIIWFKTYE
jgi:hypothetical protein